MGKRHTKLAAQHDLAKTRAKARFAKKVAPKGHRIKSELGVDIHQAHEKAHKANEARIDRVTSDYEDIIERATKCCPDMVEIFNNKEFSSEFERRVAAIKFFNKGGYIF